MKKLFLKRFLATAVACSMVLGSFSIWNISNETEKQYVVVSKSKDTHNVDTYKLTSLAARKMKQSDDTILVIEENGTVFGSTTEGTGTWKGNKAQKEQYSKVADTRSFKNLEQEWNVHAVRATNVQSPNNEKVKIAIIDSGVDFTQDIDVALRKNFVPGEDEIPVLYEDRTGHGTGVAGIIAAKDDGEGITGINPNVELYSAKVLDSKLTAPISRVVEAIYWAIDNKVDIINISFGTTTDSEALKLAIQDAYNAGILIIGAAGNKGVLEYPAAYDEVVAVGSVDSKGDHSEGSGTGEGLELMAPGEQIVSTSAFGGVAVMSGTSMSAPHVAAIASALWQKDLGKSRDFIRAVLDLSANKYGGDAEYGYGLVDLEYALQQYEGLALIYDNNKTFAENIQNAKERQLFSDDQREVISFDDVDYVEGSWSADKVHGPLAGSDSIDSGQPLSTEGLKIVKLGAVKTDDILPGFTTYPQWHGFTSKQTGGSKVPCNYMASYIYITQKAAALNNGTTSLGGAVIPAIDKAAIDSAFKSNGVGDVGKTDWTNLLEGNSVTAKNKSLFVYGMALHTATDLYAHSTYYHPSGGFINHDLGADLVGTIYNRYACAEYMSTIVVSHIKRNRTASIDDFWRVANEAYNKSNPEFKMGQYSKCAMDTDSTYYNSHKAEFDIMSK